METTSVTSSPHFDILRRDIDALFEEQPIESHPFCAALSDGTLSVDDVRHASLCVYHVVKHFPRFLAAILTQLPDYRVRMPLVENLFEEHGHGKEAHVHSVTYEEFLRGIGVSDDEIADSAPGVAEIAYNRAITDLCLHHHWLEGLGALGVIEEIVARVSPIVGQYATATFASNRKSLTHFTSHAVLDISHANEIYELAAPHYHGDGKAHVRRGMELGMYYHRRLYSDIMEKLAALRREAVA